MKIRFLIIIGIITVLGFVFTLVAIDSFDKLSAEPFSNLPPQLRSVLNYCEEKKLGHDMNLIGLNYYNDTHYIDNNSCEWRLLENYPNSDSLCIPGEQNFLTPNEIRNDTHIYNKDQCSWQLPLKTLSTAESRDLKCLRIYKDIREISRTPEMALADTHTLQSLKNVMDKYLYYSCPDFPDFEFMYDGLKNIPSDEFGAD